MASKALNKNRIAAIGSTRSVSISLCFHKLIHFCTLHENVLKAYLCKKGVLNEISYNLVVHTVTTLQPAFPHSQITPLQHFIGVRYIHLSEKGISKMGAWFLDYIIRPYLEAEN